MSCNKVRMNYYGLLRSKFDACVLLLGSHEIRLIYEPEILDGTN